jgi:hypothetical protein
LLACWHVTTAGDSQYRLVAWPLRRPAVAVLRYAKARHHRPSKGAALDNQDKDIRVNILAPTAYTQRPKGYFDKQPQIKLDKLHVSRVSPVVLYLAPRDCPSTARSSAPVWDG